jgi:hypothetical protein
MKELLIHLSKVINVKVNVIIIDDETLRGRFQHRHQLSICFLLMNPGGA